LTAEITDDGLVSVSGFTITPSDLLENNDPTTFDQAFAEWCLLKREQSIEKATEILLLYDNQPRFSALKLSYQQEAVIPFVGAGMSNPSGYPCWTDFLKDLCNHSSVSLEKLANLLEQDQYEEAAQLFVNSMPRGAFNEFLQNTFIRDDQPICGAIRYLPHMFKGSVITTNFDDLLKRLYDENSCNFKEDLLGGEAIDFPRYLGQGRNVLVRLHGKATSTKHRILTKEEYDSHYTGDHDLAKVIESISSKTLLFLGCSLGVDRTVSHLKELAKKKGADSATRHYAFLPIDDNNSRIIKRDLLAEANIFPIWYKSEDDHDECIVALLEMLRGEQ